MNTDNFGVAPSRSRVFFAVALALAMPAASLAADPGKWSQDVAIDGVPRLITPGIDRALAEREDVKRFDRGEPLRYAIPMAHVVQTDAFGIWDRPDAMTSRWRLRIASPEATSINLGFTKFELPQGARLRLLDSKGQVQFRDFTADDNEDHGQLWTPLVKGNEIVIELTVPTSKLADVRLRLTSINHGYRLPGEALKFMKSGACNVDVICPQGDGWRDQIKSSAVISTGGSTFCSGSLINNAAQDGKPYFLTAFHCNITAGAAPSLVTFWNFENSTCRTPGSPASGGAGDGSLAEFNTGSILRAASSPTDFTLVELDDPINPAHELYWSGWDRRAIDFASATGIHHPNTDEKRISFENQPTTTTTYLGDASPGNGTHIRIADWDVGTTEGGSSGSPLYSPDKRVIGQLHGGFAACGNDDADWYGRLSVSWAGGGTAATRLSNWLDPGGSGVDFIDGTSGSPFAIAAVPTAIEHCVVEDGNQANATINVTVVEPPFSAAVTLSAIGNPANSTLGFGTNPVTPPGSSSMSISNLQLVANGSYPITVTGTNAADTSQTAVSLSVAQDFPGTPVPVAPLNGATGVGLPVQLQWQAQAGAADYLVEVFTTPPPASPIFSQVIAGTSVTVPGLSGNTTYSWRVSAGNTCGDSATSALATFTTVALSCQTFSNTTAAPIGPDDGDVTTSQIAVAGLGSSVTSVTVVGMRGTHTYTGDLDFELTSPDATNRVLLSGLCGTAENFHLTLDDAAANAIACPLGNPAASPQVARPANTLAVFGGGNPNGNWTLTITDNADQDGGTLQGWGVNVCTAATGSVDATDDNYTLSEDTSYPQVAPGVLGNDTASSGVLTASLVSFPGTGILEVGLLEDGSFHYYPQTDFCGTDSFTYSATNGSLSDTATVTFTVSCVNDAPLADTLADASVHYGSPVSIDAAAAFSDPDEDALAYAMTGHPASLSIDPATGAITGTPAEAEIGSYTIQVTASDPSSASDSASFTLEVLGDLVFVNGFESP